MKRIKLQVNNKTFSIKDISKTLNITDNMAGKYLKGANLPPLTKALILEAQLGIPTTVWNDIKLYIVRS